MLYFGIITVLFGLFIWLCHKSINTDAPFGMFIVLLIISIPWFISYTKHASNLATIQEQHRVITIYHKRMGSLTERLTNLSRGDVSIALLNADTPIAALVSSITNMELHIAEAEERKAIAYRSIAARKLGLMSSVPWFFRDIE